MTRPVDPQSLYLHIPFCDHLCAYCDFPKVLFQERWAFLYLQELKKEIESKGISQVETLYVGGGTPTALPEPLLKDLLSFLRPYLSNSGEFTVEANPENLSDAKLRLLLDYGVNRLSLGIESSQGKYLALMGRHHTFFQAETAIKKARQIGFQNINADLIYALPGESLAELSMDIEAFLSLNTDHLSAYCLSINPGTVFHNRGFHEMNDDSAADQYEKILSSFRDAGFDRYEVSNFCRQGKESRHNLTYWRDEEYYAAGMGACGYEKGIRYDNTKNLQEYLKGHWRAQEEKIDEKSGLEYFFLTNLRLEKGFTEASFRQRFGFDFGVRYASAKNRLIEEGLCEEIDGSFRATDRGLLLLDRILLELYE